MKKLLKNFLFSLCAVGFLFSAVSCEKDNDRDRTDDEIDQELYQPILINYVETTILPTYEGLAKAALEMRDANNALKNSLTDDNMKAASAAWMKTRIYWELSEAFLFGPISENGFNIDEHIDSWPLELKEIEEQIEEIRNGSGTLSGEEAWLELDAEVIGFHVAEYLLYRDGQTRPVADLDAAELSYLTAVTDALVWDCVLAYVAWAGETKVNTNYPEMITILKANSDVWTFYNSRSRYHNFGEQFKNGTFYNSWRNTVDEIASGAAEIADEVGATKIAEPYEDRNVLKVESWYSWHSLDDYENNIISIKNAYLGGIGNDSRPADGKTLSAYVASVDASLDREIKAQIEDCIEKIQNIGTGGKSFYEVVRDQINKSQVDAAVDACLDLKDLFDEVSKILE